MKFCSECAEEHRWQKTVVQERDTCDLCGRYRDCNVSVDGPPIPAEVLRKVFQKGIIERTSSGSVIRVVEEDNEREV